MGLVERSEGRGRPEARGHKDFWSNMSAQGSLRGIPSLVVRGMFLQPTPHQGTVKTITISVYLVRRFDKTHWEVRSGPSEFAAKIWAHGDPGDLTAVGGSIFRESGDIQSPPHWPARAARVLSMGCWCSQHSELSESKRGWHCLQDGGLVTPTAKSVTSFGSLGRCHPVWATTQQCHEGAHLRDCCHAWAPDQHQPTKLFTPPTSLYPPLLLPSFLSLPFFHLSSSLLFFDIFFLLHIVA